MEIIEINNAVASVKIALQGAHIFHYQRKGEEPLLWLSDTSDFEYGKAIRGGVPICWPSFGMNNPELPQHGFARTAKFVHVETKEIDESTTEVTLKLTHSKETLLIWAYQFDLELKVSISDTLTMELKTTNKDSRSFTITQALHTYFSVSDILHVEIKGLDKKPYLDALTNKQCLQNGDIVFRNEVDRVYQEVDSEIVLKDKNRTVNIKNEGSSSAVVWNPWIEKGSRMSGMKADAYKQFVCIESANAFEDFVVLEPNESHTLKATIY